MEFLRMVSDEVSPHFRSAATHLICFFLPRPHHPDLLTPPHQATQLSTKDGKSTIGPDHIYRSMEALGSDCELSSWPALLLFVVSAKANFRARFPPDQHAAQNIGFKEEWKKKLDEAHADYKESLKAKPKISKNPGAATGLSMEELIRQQKEMLAEVREKCEDDTMHGSVRG